MKNLSPRWVSLFASGSVSLIVFFFLLLMHLLLPSLLHPSLVLLIPVVVLAVSCVLFPLAMDEFIFKKIEMIYRNISRFKTSDMHGSEPKNIPKKDVIGLLEKETMDLANRQIKEIEALKELAQYRKEFLGNVSHELKTPVFNIQGYLHTLIDGGMDDPQVNKRYLLKASENLERLDNIIHDLEIISQIESNSLTLDFIHFNIVELIEEVFGELYLKAAQKGIHLKLQEGNDHAVFVRADRESIRQVLTNLVSNSIRYGKPGGETVVGVSEKGGSVAVEVADNGIGIAQEHLPRIFERFYRVDKSRSRELGGTGLGLSIVKHILEAHGQTIQVISTPGEGSVFSFSL
ncbi:MAG TPA: ATP-binding protein [Chitinophagales bacterium]|nr:ATP-binding protein [Chitinophagales bacterium]